MSWARSLVSDILARKRRASNIIIPIFPLLRKRLQRLRGGWSNETSDRILRHHDGPPGSSSPYATEAAVAAVFYNRCCRFAKGFAQEKVVDDDRKKKFRVPLSILSAHFALRIGPFWPRGNQLYPTPFSGSPPPPPFGRQVDAARCTRSLSSQPLSLSASPAIFAIAINALDSPARQLFAFQLHHRRRLCTLLRRIGMKDQIPNTTDHRCSRSPAALPPSASPPSPLSPSSCRGAAVAPALLSPCVAVAVSRFSLLLLLSLARL